MAERDARLIAPTSRVACTRCGESTRTPPVCGFCRLVDATFGELDDRDAVYDARRDAYLDAETSR